jgi:hypothetical protein
VDEECRCDAGQANSALVPPVDLHLCRVEDVLAVAGSCQSW